MPNAIASGRSAAVILALLLGACGEEMMPPPDGDPTCNRDDVGDPGGPADEPAEAGDLVDGMAMAFICPRDDQDWYRLTIPPGERLVNVQLTLPTMRSPIEPTYAIWATDAAGEAERAVATPGGAGAGDLDEVHCLDSGEYFIVVRDQNNDAADLRNAYNLFVSTEAEPDDQEPNESDTGAVELTPGQTRQGYIGCVGDEDWYAVDVPPGFVLSVRLTSPTATYEPTYRIVSESGEQIDLKSNLGGRLRPTDIGDFRVLPAAGRYFVVVSDDDGGDADFAVPYELFVDLVVDNDPNEPNNSPTEATELGAESCSGAWSTYQDIAGSIGSPSDNDWFLLPLSGCNGGLVDAELTVQGAAGLTDEELWALQDEVQASITIVREDGASPCAEDSDCLTLQRSCEDEWDCEGYFNACAPEGVCIGASVCAPTGFCGANQIERHYDERMVPSSITGPPPTNETSVSAPILGGDDRLWLRVSDFQSNGGTPDAEYRLRVRVRQDPDRNEAGTPNNLYGNLLNNDNLPVSESQPRARSLTVQGPGGCGGGSAGWVTGAISYENDLDWFTYAHPCPGEDCMVRVHYEVDAGPVQHFLGLFTGSRNWFTFDLGSGGSGTFGGLGADDECVYAYFRHDRPYYMLVRDVAEPTRDYDADQSYRVCIERAANGCQPPCMDFGETGCGQP